MAVAAPQASWVIGKHALLSLRVRRRGDRTDVHPLARRIPYQFLGVHHQDHDDEPFVLLHNSAGGFVEGDSAELHVDVERDSRALLTTMGATKYYKSEHGGEARDLVEIHAAAGALVEYLPDEAIPYKDSRTVRCVRMVIAPTSRLFATDFLAAGRVHYGQGECFAFAGMRSELELVIGDRLVFLDRLILEPDDVWELDRLWHGHHQLVTMLAYAPDMPAGIEADVERSAQRDGTVVGCSRRGGLLCVRVLAHETWQAHEAVFAAWATLRPAIAGKPARAIRKC